MLNLKLFLLIFLSITCFSNEINIDSITLSKIKKMVQKEEEIAFAYKKFILQQGKVPQNLESLLTTDTLIIGLKYLPLGYSKINPFGKIITLNTTKHQIENFMPLNSQLKSNLYDYYYNNKNRIYTQAPLSLENNSLNIILSVDEKFIVDNSSNITKIKSEANKYYLDDRGILHWYDGSNNYKFSITNDLLVDQSVKILDDSGIKSADFENLIGNKNFMYAGQKILHKNEDTDSIDEYLNTNINLIEVDRSRNIGQTILKFTKYGGGVIINGDINIWGNNKNNITGIGKNSYTNTTGAVGTGTPIINTFIHAKAIMYDDTKETLQETNDFNTKNFYSSPLRPKFIDFFSDVNHSTCGVTTKGELYCGGNDALENNYITFSGYTRGSASAKKEFLYRSLLFDGKSYKSKKVFALGNTYMILGKPISDTVDGYNVYFWGKDNIKGWAGTGVKTEINIFAPTKIINQTRFKDLVYTYENSSITEYRKIAGLDLEGNIYTWGLNTENTSASCIQTLAEGIKNFCEPLKVEANINFVSIRGGQKDFIATDSDGSFYKISHLFGSKATIEAISTLIESKIGYDSINDARILSTDTTLTNGIIWVNGKNQLKGDIHIPTGADTNLFNNTISKIEWKEIRVINDKMMCGIDKSNQLYCWGDMAVSGVGTFMLPMFMANLHDEKKDYLLLENDSANTITNMTSGEWLNSGNYVMKYPTYIGGFNYEFIFK